MKGQATFSCLLTICLALASSSALAQRGGTSTHASPPLKTLMLENDKELGEMEAMLNKLDAAENATSKLDEAWLNKMIKEQREGYYRSLYPEGRQKVKKAYPELGVEP